MNTTNPTETITAADLAAEHLDTTPTAPSTPPPAASPPPEPNAMPVNPATGSPWTALEIAAMGKSKSGQAFDPRKHAPKLDTAGRWVGCNIGRKAKQHTFPFTQTPTTKPAKTPAARTAGRLVVPNGAAPVDAPGAPAAKPSPPPVTAKESAETICAIVYFGTGLLFGQMDESTPPPEEHATYRDQTAAECDRRGFYLSGWMATLVVWICYFRRFLDRPKVKAAREAKRQQAAASAPAPAAPSPGLETVPTNPAPTASAFNFPIPSQP